MKNLISAEPKTLPSTMRYVAHGEGARTASASARRGFGAGARAARGLD